MLKEFWTEFLIAFRNGNRKQKLLLILFIPLFTALLLVYCFFCMLFVPLEHFLEHFEKHFLAIRKGLRDE